MEYRLESIVRRKVPTNRTEMLASLGSTVLLSSLEVQTLYREDILRRFYIASTHAVSTRKK